MSVTLDFQVQVKLRKYYSEMQPEPDSVFNYTRTVTDSAKATGTRRCRTGSATPTLAREWGDCHWQWKSLSEEPQAGCNLKNSADSAATHH